MENRRSREFQMHQERDASWSRLRSEPWRPRGHRRAHGSGLPRVQIVSLPAFGSPSFWEICQRGDDWLLYTAKVVNRDWHDLTVLGYEPVEFESDRLRAYFDGFVATSLPIGPDRSGMGGCDGAVTQLP